LLYIKSTIIQVLYAFYLFCKDKRNSQFVLIIVVVVIGTTKVVIAAVEIVIVTEVVVVMKEVSSITCIILD